MHRTSTSEQRRWPGRRIAATASGVGLRGGLLLAVFVGLTWPLGAAEEAESPEPGDLRCAESFEEFVSDARSSRRDPGAPPPLLSESLYRAGWWASDVKGSPTRIGEYQDLNPSPFWDVSHRYSDGVQTQDLHATGLDNEGTDAGWYYFGPEFSADIDYQRYLHRLDHDPLSNWGRYTTSDDGSGTPPETGFVAEDLNVGQDYAIRVQQIKANFAGRLNETWRWRVRAWSMRKSGERQANALSQSFRHPDATETCSTCHLHSRSQEIDWRTTELEPSVEGRWGPLTVALAMPVRSFRQHDQTLTRLYNSYPEIYGGQPYPPQLGSENFPAGNEYPYAMVPDNFTQMRKLKFGLDLTDQTHLYGLLYQGTTDNELRDTRRNFDGFDLRLTDRTYEKLTLTGYVKLNHENSDSPEVLISGEELAFDRYDETEVPCDVDNSRDYGGCGCSPVESPCVIGHDGVADFFASDALVEPIDYTRTTAGLNGRFTPFRGDRSWRRGLTFYGGYEFRRLQRGQAEFAGAVSLTEEEIIDEADTYSHRVHVGAAQRWTRMFDTFVRYKTQYFDRPLFGVRETNGTTNSNLPTHVALVELGANWSPIEHFLASVTFGIENRFQHSLVANFDEDSYPLTVTLWHAPTQALSFSAAYAYRGSWLDQDITLGDDLRDGAAYAPVTKRWGYGGRSQVWSLGAVYACTPRLRLRGDVQYVRGHNAIDATVFEAPYVWPEIAALTRDVIESSRISAGFDHTWSPRVASYFRYNLYTYHNAVRDYEDGTAALFLVGLSGAY